MGEIFASCGHQIAWEEVKGYWWEDTPGEWSYGCLCDDCVVEFQATEKEPDCFNSSILALTEDEYLNKLDIVDRIQKSRDGGKGFSRIVVESPGAYISGIPVYFVPVE